jgi:hypothetical protein
MPFSAKTKTVTGDQMQENMSSDAARQIALDFLKKRKTIERIDALLVEQEKEDWIVTGTSPIRLEGRPWAEKFKIVVDNKGRIKSMECSLL